MAESGPPRIPFRRRSRVVAWAKVLLPLAALALMSTVFLLAREGGGEIEIPFARIEEIAREPRIDRPRLAGVAPDGTTVALTAERITPEAGAADRFALAAPRLDTGNPDGSAARLVAGAGVVDGPARTLRLTGGVRLDADPATVVETPEADADLATGTVDTGPITADTPFGRLEAGGMTLRQGEGDPARMVFHDGVRLLYQPLDPTRPEAP